MLGNPKLVDTVYFKQENSTLNASQAADNDTEHFVSQQTPNTYSHIYKNVMTNLNKATN